MKRFAVIFDMDGTLLDNNGYHLKAWQSFFKEYGKTLSEKEYKEKISGISSAATIRNFFGSEVTDDEVTAYRNKKEEIYRQLIAPYIKPVTGLIPFLQTLQKQNIPLAIATSATIKNIDFTMKKLNLQPYFPYIIDSSMVNKGKPDPDIYLAAAKKLHIPPERCVAFEDSVNGVRSAKAAGMKVIAINTSHQKEKLSNADLILEDYTQINVQKLMTLFPDL